MHLVHGIICQVLPFGSVIEWCQNACASLGGYLVHIQSTKEDNVKKTFCADK